MDCEAFRDIFLSRTREAHLTLIGLYPREQVEMRSMDRTFEVQVEGVTRGERGPIHVSASISWRWDALQTARTRTREEDVLRELLGDDRAEGATARPWLRVDLRLRAGTGWGKPLRMPTALAWTRFAKRASKVKLVEGGIPAFVGDDTVPAWQGQPEAEVVVLTDGSLRLEAVSIEAFQGIYLPRQWDDPDREPDAPPHRQLDAMFARVAKSLALWSELAGGLA